MEKKCVFITGAASGIGLGLAQRFAEQDYAVVMTDLNAIKVEDEAKRLCKQGFDVRAIQVDVTDEKQLSSCLKSTILTNGQIDVLINNAGLQYVAPIEDFPTEQFEKMLRVMVTAPFIAIKHTLPSMKKRGYGRIINLASINGLVGFAGKSAYNSAKHGLIGLTKVTALEVAEYGITVNALCPGYVNTPLVRNQLADLAQTRGVELEKVLQEVIYPLVPQKRLLEVDEIVHYALFLADKRARGITGQAIVIDGGYTTQ